jgi:hypothetical protein
VVRNDSFKDDADREAYAAAERETERAATVHCPHCGTPGEYTYSGVVGPWSKDDGKQLYEFSEELHWTGRHHMGKEHTPDRCIEALVAKLRDAQRPADCAHCNGSCLLVAR